VNALSGFAVPLLLRPQDYLMQLPGAVKEAQLPDGSTAWQSVYTPHSLRATTATLLLDAGVDIIKVKELLGHRHVTTTQIYDKRRRSTSESASHLLAI
jgi:integrase